MRLTSQLSAYKHNLTVYWVVLSLTFVCVSCSSNNGKDKKGDQTPSPVTSEEEPERLRRENANLKRTPAKAVEKEKRSESSADEKKQTVISYDSKSKMEGIIEEFNSAIEPEKKIELIESLGDLSFGEDTAVIGVVQKALSDPDPEVGRHAIELLEDYRTAEILPVVAEALNSEDEQIRKKALAPLSGVNDPQVGQLLTQALSDTSENVRAVALELVDSCCGAEESKDPIKLEIMRTQISSSHNDVKYAMVSMLEDEADHSAVDILIEGLKDSDPDFREEVNASLDFMIDKEFKTYEEARAWWKDNKDNYDDELFQLEEEDEPEPNKPQ